MLKLRGELDHSEMWIYRRMLKISHQQHISNEGILVGLNVKPQLKKVQVFWAYCKWRRYEYQRLLLEGTVDGKRGRGRPRNTWLSNIRDWLGIGFFVLCALLLYIIYHSVTPVPFSAFNC